MNFDRDGGLHRGRGEACGGTIGLPGANASKRKRSGLAWKRPRASCLV